MRLVTADLVIKPSADKFKQMLNLIEAHAQSGKAAEMKWALWATGFILGCFPRMNLRRAGGRADAETAKQDIRDMNEEIEAFLEDLRLNKGEDGSHGTGPWGQEFSWLTPDVYYKFTLEPKVVTDPDRREGILSPRKRQRRSSARRRRRRRRR